MKQHLLNKAYNTPLGTGTFLDGSSFTGMWSTGQPYTGAFKNTEGYIGHYIPDGKGKYFLEDSFFAKNFLVF